MTALTNDEPNTIGNDEALETPVLRAAEPSHIHIPRPSRVPGRAVAAAVLGRSALRATVDAE